MLLCVCLILGHLLHGMSFAHLIYNSPKDVPPGSSRFSPSQEYHSEYVIKALLDVHVGISLGIDAQEWNCWVLGLWDPNLASSRLLSNLMSSCPLNFHWPSMQVPIWSHSYRHLVLSRFLLFASWICIKWVPCCFDLLLLDYRGFSCAYYVSGFPLLGL